MFVLYFFHECFFLLYLTMHLLNVYMLNCISLCVQLSFNCMFVFVCLPEYRACHMLGNDPIMWHMVCQDLPVLVSAEGHQVKYLCNDACHACTSIHINPLVPQPRFYVVMMSAYIYFSCCPIAIILCGSYVYYKTDHVWSIVNPQVHC